MSDLEPDRVTETRTTGDPTYPRSEVTRTTERSSGAAWIAVALVGVALIAAVTFVITRPASNTDAAVAAATQQVQSQVASQQAQGAAAQAQSAADRAALAGDSAAARASSAPSQPRSDSPDQSPPPQSQPSQSSDQGGGSPPQQ